MASLTMSDLSYYEPMRKNWFIVQFTDIVGTGSTGEDPESLSIACKTCDIPHLTTFENKVDRINDIVYTPGKSEYQTISLSFNEYIQYSSNEGSGNTRRSAGEILSDWQQKVHSPKTGVQGSKSSIAKNCAIVQINGDGSVVRVWNVYSCWPTDVQYSNLDSADGAVQDVTVTLRYDWAEMTNKAITATETPSA